jgi:hypothetical protein
MTDNVRFTFLALVTVHGQFTISIEQGKYELVTLNRISSVLDEGIHKFSFFAPR